MKNDSTRTPRETYRPHTANLDAVSEAPNGEMKKCTRPQSKRASETSNAIETAAAIKKEARELCDELDFHLKELRAEVERSRGTIHGTLTET